MLPGQKNYAFDFFSTICHSVKSRGTVWRKVVLRRWFPNRITINGSTDRRINGSPDQLITGLKISTIFFWSGFWLVCRGWLKVRNSSLRGLGQKTENCFLSEAFFEQNWFLNNIEFQSKGSESPGCNNFKFIWKKFSFFSNKMQQVPGNCKAPKRVRTEIGVVRAQAHFERISAQY